MQNTQIIPAVLPKSFEELDGKLNLLKEAYYFLNTNEKLMVQIDVCYDDLFKNFDFSVIDKYSSVFNFELDLMSINIDFIKQRLNELSRSNFRRVIFHYADWGDDVFDLKDKMNLKQEIGLAVLSKQDLTLFENNLDKIDFVQFMGIDKVGVQGGQFNPKVIEKIKEFRKEKPEIIISVDGGVNLENAQDLIEVGAGRLVSGSAIFGKDLPAEEVALNIKKFS